VSTENLPLVSTVITTRNEEKNIERCLLSVKRQTYDNIELIVVDNFSEDRTCEIAMSYTQKVYSKGNERSSQRNFGAKLAQGKYLVYLDADMILSPSLIQRCVAKAEKEKLEALYIPERITGKGFWIKVRDFERSFYTGTVIDAARFVRRDLFLKIQGFDETLTGPEDWDFDRRIRRLGKINTVNEPLFHNEGTFNLRRYLSKKKYYSAGVNKYLRKWGPKDSEAKKQTGLRYRLIDVFVEQGKWKKLVRHPCLAAGMYFLRFNVALGYFQKRM
jgi:glycosyltransferase involved in cell wall biosynthesis